MAKKHAIDYKGYFCSLLFLAVGKVITISLLSRNFKCIISGVKFAETYSCLRSYGKNGARKTCGRKCHLEVMSLKNLDLDLFRSTSIVMYPLRVWILWIHDPFLDFAKKRKR